jgi:5-methylcytosine-specific restriction endonuclease McrA
MARYNAVIPFYEFQKLQKLNAIIAYKNQSGGCMLCGSKDDLEFHHVEHKRFNIGHFSSPHISVKKLRRELRACVVLCHNCHTDIHKQIEAIKC